MRDDIVRNQWLLALAVVLSLGLGGVSATPVPAVAQEDVSIGTPGHFVQYGRDYANAGDWAMAESYANLALRLKADHPGALRLLADARRALAPVVGPGTGTGTGPAAGPGPAAGEDVSIGSPGYFLKYGREYAAAGDWDLAESYARRGLNLDANHAGSLQLLAEAREARAAAARATPPRRRAPVTPRPTPPAENQSCDDIYGACYASARRYTPGSPPAVDYAGQQQCMVRRNICYAQRR